MGKLFSDTAILDSTRMKQTSEKVSIIFRRWNVKLYPIGNTNESCHSTKDLDFLVNVHELAKYFDCLPDQAKRTFAARLRDFGFITRVNANIVHASVPVFEGLNTLVEFRAQVDFILCEYPEEIRHFHTYVNSDLSKPHKYKSRHRHIILARRAKERGYLWSPFQGLFARKDGKKAEFVCRDYETVGKLVLDNEMAFCYSVERFVEKFASEEDRNSPRWNG